MYRRHNFDPNNSLLLLDYDRKMISFLGRHLIQILHCLIEEMYGN